MSTRDIIPSNATTRLQSCKFVQMMFKVFYSFSHDYGEYHTNMDMLMFYYMQRMHCPISSRCMWISIQVWWIWSPVVCDKVFLWFFYSWCLWMIELNAANIVNEYKCNWNARLCPRAQQQMQNARGCVMPQLFIQLISLATHCSSFSETFAYIRTIHFSIAIRDAGLAHVMTISKFGIARKFD